MHKFVISAKVTKKLCVTGMKIWQIVVFLQRFTFLSL